jgi:peptide/nickel transport system permease protein
MIETLREDYILAARAKGLTENKIVYKHAFRNAMLPVFTIIGMQLAELIGGAIVTETVFNLPGMGSLLMQSIFRRDYPVIQGCVAAYAISIVVVTTIVDCIYGFLDPRVSI